VERDALLALFDREQRYELVSFNEQRELAPPVVRYLPAQGQEAFVLYSDLRGADVDAIIRREIDYFTRAGRSFEWKVYSHDYPSDLNA
jgi:hypothetical protein